MDIEVVGTVQQALDVAVPGDRVLVPPGVWAEDLRPPPGVIVLGLEGPAATVIAGTGAGPVLQGIGAGWVVGLTLDGLGAAPCAAWAGGDLQLVDLVLTGCAAIGPGAAVAVAGTDLVLSGVRIEPVVSAFDGGQVSQVGGVLAVSFGTFVGGEGANGGAVDAAGAVVTIDRTRFDGATASGDGGAVRVVGPSLSVTGSRFTEALAGGLGGAIQCGSPICFVSHSWFQGGEAASGGALAASGGLADVRASVFCDNTASVAGGALLLDGTTSYVDGTLVVGSTAPAGGGAAVLGAAAVNVVHVDFVANDATDGAAVQAGSAGAAVSVIGSAVVGNTGDEALVGGAGLLVTGFDLFADNPLGDADVTLAPSDLPLAPGTPVFAGPLGCLPEDLLPGPGSPLVDAGTGPLDADGSTADIGAFGGAQPNPWLDLDGDGVRGPEDCDDADPAVALAGPLWPDADADGWGEARATWSYGCPAPGLASRGLDCDDLSVGIHPDTVDACGDGVDDDCSGVVDDNPLFGPLRYPDADGDGHGDPAGADRRCADVEPGWVSDATDCDDAAAAIHPGAPERCDGVDEDCDGLVDDGPTDALPFLRDQDRDGYGAGEPLAACAAPAGFVAAAGDCDDGDPEVWPGAFDACGDGLDADCDDLDPDCVPRGEAPAPAGAGCGCGTGPVGGGPALLLLVGLLVRRPTGAP